MKRLDRLRRFFATMLGFILFGVAGVLFKIALLPYTLKSTRGDVPRQLAARRMIGRVWRFFVGYLQWSGVLSVTFRGAEKLGRGGQLILANHPSLLDVVLLVSHAPDPNVLVKKDLVRNPSMSSQIRAAGYIPNDESMEMLDEIEAVFQSGQSLLIFPRRHAHGLGRAGQNAPWRGIHRLTQRKSDYARSHQNEPAQLQKRAAVVQNPAAQNPLRNHRGRRHPPRRLARRKTAAHRRAAAQRISARLFHKENHMNDLEHQIKQLIIDSLALEDITPADIGSEEPLFGDEGLGLDSVDALELGLAVQKTFGFQLDGENDNLRDNFANVKTLAEFVRSRQAQA